MANSEADIIQLFTTLAISIFGSSIGEVVGPYLLVIFAATTGAAWSLGRRTSRGRTENFFYFIRIVFIAIVLTVVCAKVASQFIPNVGMELLIAPVALLIGLIGDSWYQVIDWVLGAMKKIANRILDKKMDE